jgi:hypothetical protein
MGTKPHLCIAVLLKILAAALALSNPHQRTPSLQVWDNVLLPRSSQRQTLHEYASKSGLGHSCFSRPLKGERNEIELALDAILKEIESDVGAIIGTKEQYVEYWSRQEWRHIGEIICAMELLHFVFASC